MTAHALVTYMQLQLQVLLTHHGAQELFFISLIVL